MKRICTTVALLTIAVAAAFAAPTKNGYRIQLKFTDIRDSVAYLAYYYGKPLPTIYKADSVRLDKNGSGVISSTEETVGGIYMILLPDKKTYFEFLLNNGDDISITATAAKLPQGLTFRNSPENERFHTYVNFLQTFAADQQALQAKMSAAKTAADSESVRKKMTEEGKKLTQYRKDYTAKYPKTLLTTIFNALETPQVPEGQHLLPNGKVDSLYAYNYYKEHYWDSFDFTDDRLIHTPIYDAKLEEYFNRLVVPMPDSINKEGDKLLAKTRGRKELFKYTLFWVTRNAEVSKIMGMDESFVYFVENYFMRGDAYWLDNEALAKYTDKAQKIAPNILGNVAPEITMKDPNNKVVKLSDIKSKYTLVVFWSPDCGHCVTEMPKLDSTYRAVLKDKGVKVMAIRTEGTDEQWREFIQKYKLQDWVNANDPDHTSDYRSKYDVYSTPVIYLLDEKKIIRGKRLDHTNILEVIEMLERKEKNALNK